MSAAADDVLKRLAAQATRRLDFEHVWRQVAAVAAPDVGDFVLRSYGTGAGAASAHLVNKAVAARRSKALYDSTAVWCVDRLASGLEALIIPQSEYWHNLTVTDFVTEATTHAEKLFFERLRNLMFRARYDADTGWTAAFQTGFRRLVAFGNAFIWVEESYDRRSLIRYRHIPLPECYIGVDHQGKVDTFSRYYALTARQAVQKFGSRTPPKIAAAAERPDDADRYFTFVHQISPRADFGHPSEGLARAPWAGLHVCEESRSIVGESGYHEFPIVDLRWLPEDSEYGEGPVMKALSDIQSLQAMAKNELTASHQAVAPPLLIANAGVMNRPNAAPSSITYGGMTADGRRLVEPLFNSQRQDFATLVLEAKRNQVKESLYINLFAILVQNPQMSATEALLRANEKGELLGPAGTRIQQSLSGGIERELGIYERRGLYDRGSAYIPPPTLRNRDIGPEMSGPINRLRRAKEAEATINVLNIVSPLAQIDPSVIDNFEPDEMTRGLSEVLGMPTRFLATPEKVAQRRADREQQQQLASDAVIAKDLAGAGKQGVEALNALTGA